MSKKKKKKVVNTGRDISKGILLMEITVVGNLTLILFDISAVIYCSQDKKQNTFFDILFYLSI